VTADVQATRDGRSRATHDCRTTATCLPRLARPAAYEPVVCTGSFHRAEGRGGRARRRTFAHLAHDSAGNDVGGAEAEIVELIPGERIVLHWQFVGPDRMTDPAMTTLLTVTFTPTPSGTQLDLTHDRLDNLREQFPSIAEQVRPGWESALDALGAGTW